MKKPRRITSPRYPPLSPLAPPFEPGAVLTSPGRSSSIVFPPPESVELAVSCKALSTVPPSARSSPLIPHSFQLPEGIVDSDHSGYELRARSRSGWEVSSFRTSFTPTLPPARCTLSTPSSHVGIKILYNFEDYNVVFQVQDALYRVHRYFFRRESSKFANMFDSNPGGGPIPLEDVSCAEFDALLEFMYSAMFESEPLSLEKWISVLHVSNMWDMGRIKGRAIKHLNDLDGLGPIDRIVIGAKEGVNAWFLPAYSSLVEREEPLSVEEARKLNSLGERQAGSVVGMDIFPLLAQARERFRNSRNFRQKVITAEGIVGEVFGGMSTQRAESLFGS